ncbi:MAG: ATP-binding protein [Chloroflexi bacterium]|nr:ATP-binding protein [Chloroflexota bacterium]MCL5274693.1 ATP-binding protein [Chloroflexota bacterium]
MDSKNTFRYAWQPYVVAVALIAVAAGLRLWPLQILGVRLTWLTFYPAVMAAALYGGFSAGLLGIFLSCLTMLYLLPVFVTQPFIQNPVDWLGMAVFAITCTMISFVAEAMRRARAREKQTREQLGAANKELEAANKELESANKELAAANKELEAFSYSVSHDLRAPLRAIDGFSRILMEDYATQLDPEALRYFNLVRDNSRQMGNLVDDLLSFSRLSRQALRKQSVKTTALVRQSLDELRAETNGRRVEFTVGDPSPFGSAQDGSGQALPECQADPNLLKQVWINLLSNALKYTRKREVARIEIGWKKENDEQVFFVKDNGVGFDMKYVHKLFGIFQRLHRSEDYEGTGVGLAIVQRIVHRHGGRVWAESQVDDGATFYFSLPLVETAAPAPVIEQADELAERARELI